MLARKLTTAHRNNPTNLFYDVASPFHDPFTNFSNVLYTSLCGHLFINQHLVLKVRY
jgi:hypothetical protein